MGCIYQINYTKIPENKAILFSLDEKKTKNLIQKYCKIHAKSVEKSAVPLCFVSRIPRFNKRKNQKRMFMTCFCHIEGHFKAVCILI